MNLNFLVIGLLLLFNFSSASYVTLTKDGYQDVVVHMEDNSTLSCQEALDHVKELIRKMSISFGGALDREDRKTHFGTVTIIAPDAWKDRRECYNLIDSNSNTSAAWARDHRADIRFTVDHPVFGSYPFSFQYGGCGHPGLPINVPYSMGASDAEGRRMAREWAHYRYGVFDEGGAPDDARHPSYYEVHETGVTEKQARANTCSEMKKLSGYWECHGNGYGPSCEYVPVINNPGIYSSLMYRPELSEMNKFCTKENHDDGVPSKLNYFCDGKSATTVIYEHQDFKPGMPMANESAEVSFNVIHNPFTGYHLIVDTSASSYFNNVGFNYVRYSLIHFINNLADGLLISIDKFDASTVTEFCPPTYLDETNRDTIIKKIQQNITTTPTGNNANAQLGSALRRSRSRAQSGQDVIILTAIDRPNSLDDIVNQFRDERVNAHLLYFRPQTDTSNPLELARITMFGSLYLLPVGDMDSSLGHNAYTWAVGALHSIYSRTKSERTKVYEINIETLNVADKSANGSFYLDGQGSTLILALYSITDDSLIIKSWTLTPPSGSTINVLDLDSDYFENYGTIALATIATSTINRGKWDFNIGISGTTASKLVRMDVWVEPFITTTNNDQPLIKLRTWNTASVDSSIALSSSKPMKPIGLYAQVTQDRRPLRDLEKVTAHVYDSTGNFLTQVDLLDHGAADVTSGDGIYSGWLTVLSNTSLAYSVRYVVEGDSMAQVDYGLYERPPTTAGSIVMTSPQSAVDNSFFRFEYGSSFQLSSINPYTDVLPPERITDLTVAEYDGSTRRITLTWTTPRDDYGRGSVVGSFKVYRTEGTNREELQTPGPPLESVELNDTKIVTFRFDVPDIGVGSYVKYRVVAMDGAGNEGPRSNTVSVAGPLPTYAEANSQALLWGLVGAAIAILVIIIIIILICKCCPTEAKRTKDQATRKVKDVFTSSTTKKTQPKPTVSQPMERRRSSSATPEPIAEWRSPNINGEESDRKLDDAHQTKSSTNGSEKIYFGQQDFNRISVAESSDHGFDDRGVDEVIKRAPSMDLQLATILLKNNSDLSIDQVGLEDKTTDDNLQFKPVGTTSNPTLYARPYKQNDRPASTWSSGTAQTTLRTFGGFNYLRPASVLPITQTQSETNLYYDRGQQQPRSRPMSEVGMTAAGTAQSSLSGSFQSVYAERADVLPAAPSPDAGQQSGRNSSLADTLRAGLRQEDWQDSSSFTYSDPRFDSTQPKSTFQQLHPANTVGLPPPPPPIAPAGGYNRTSTLSLNSYGGDQQQQQPIKKGTSKPSLVSAV